MTTARLPRPQTVDSDFWIDEAIWGHRLYNEQTPWMTLLELLGVLNGRTSTDPFREEGEFAGVHYRPTRRMALRNIVFNDPHIDELSRRGKDDGERWKEWIEKTKARSAGLDESVDFEYLRKLFPATNAQSDSFGDFARVVSLLRSTAIEGDSNKRWTSKFVFPYGPACLFPDLRLDAQGGLSMDRRFFARTGELTYLMLCRSGRGPELFSELQRTVLDARAPWNRLVERLQPPPIQVTDGSDEIRTGYLPYATLPNYEALASDLLVVLRTRLPGYDALPHVVDLIGLHLILYVLQRAAEWVPEDGDVRMVLEIIAPKRTTVRDLAVESFQTNGQRSVKAVDGFITREVEQSAAWQRDRTLSDDGERGEALRKTLWDVVRLREAKPDGDGTAFVDSNPERVMKDLRERAQRRHEAHLGDVHASYAQAIGLASRRGTRRVRYAPNDQLLKTLVLAVVPERMEFQQFLEALWAKYRMIIGHRQAADLIDGGGSDQKAFADNALRLENRLASLGLLRRLSDACAYVENPMGCEQ